MRRTSPPDNAMAGLRTAALCGGIAWLCFATAGCHTVASDEIDTVANGRPDFVPVAASASTVAEAGVQYFDTRDESEPEPDAARPWTPLAAIWFFYRSAELTSLETDKVAVIVRYATEHPGAEIAINRPSGRSVTESDNVAIDRQRVGAIRDALISAGIPPSRIQAGTFESPTASINRLVSVFVRAGH